MKTIRFLSLGIFLAVWPACVCFAAGQKEVFYKGGGANADMALWFERDQKMRASALKYLTERRQKELKTQAIREHDAELRKKALEYQKKKNAPPKRRVLTDEGRSSRRAMRKLLKMRLKKAPKAGPAEPAKPAKPAGLPLPEGTDMPARPARPAVPAAAPVPAKPAAIPAKPARPRARPAVPSALPGAVRPAGAAAEPIPQTRQKTAVYSDKYATGEAQFFFTRFRLSALPAQAPTAMRTR